MTIQSYAPKTLSDGDGRSSSKSKRGLGDATKSSPTHEQIAARARVIWQAKGCPVGKDEENWREAEAELRGPNRGGL